MIGEAEGYLRKRGAKVIYAGGLFPLNPFYWGIYGGSEGSGVLSAHQPFHRVLTERGYQPAGTTILLEADLSVPEPRDPRGVLVRRQTQVEFHDDAFPTDWWQCLALGDFQLLNARLVSRSDGCLLAHAQAWDMSWFGRGDSRSRIGLISLEVSAAHRRKGYGRFLVSEILRRARENHVGCVAVQTAATNLAGARPLSLARFPAGRTGYVFSVAVRARFRLVVLIVFFKKVEVSWHDAH